ncbi:monocarboxylate transporter 11-like [Ylistrum balloti]|uniref:monocarboxylate transporter 11-like n=1 Tax=Ylistrum balloti TaxID=509963 RepID=UPI002905C31D|nr:monocarboxylate transporter 11-like [Ylistrum balloti]
MTDTNSDTSSLPEARDAKDNMLYELPVDRGWAWVILVASTLITTLYAGIFKSFGLFYVEILDVYSSNVSTTSLISSLQFAVYCVTTVPVMTSLTRRSSIRCCQLAGILITAIGFGLSSLVHSLDLLILTQSILSGLGMALVYPTAIVLIGKYFRGRLGLANGVLMSGYALGGVTLPPLLRYILDEYRLEGALLLTAGIIINCLPPACLLRPFEFYTERNSGSTNKLEGNHVKIDSKHENMLTNSCAFKDCRNKDQSSALLSGYNPDTTLASASAPNLSSSRHVTNGVVTSGKNGSDSQIDSILTKGNAEYLEPCIFGYLSTGEFTNLSQETVRKMSKDNDSSKSVHDSSLIKRLFNKCKSWQMCSPILWRNKLFLLLIPIYCFASVGSETCHLFSPSFAKDRGISSSKIATLVSIQSMCDFVGRVLSGYIADLPRIKRQQIVMISQVIAGLIMQLTPLFHTFWSLVLFSAGYGLTAGIIFALFPPILSSSVGQDMFPTSVAVMILIKGSFVGGLIPFLGYLRDSTNEFHATFHFMGATSLIASLLLLLFDRIAVKHHEGAISVEISGD